MQIERVGVPAERTTIVRNGPELTGRQVPESDPGLRLRGKTIIGYMGVMGFQDGVDYLLRALHHLVHGLGRTDVFCVLIGGLGSAQPSLKRLPPQLCLDDYVWFTRRGSGSCLPPDFSRARCFRIPTPSNPFPDAPHI